MDMYKLQYFEDILSGLLTENFQNSIISFRRFSYAVWHLCESILFLHHEKKPQGFLFKKRKEYHVFYRTIPHPPKVICQKKMKSYLKDLGTYDRKYSMLRYFSTFDCDS